ncbi:hypothetical protein [Bosea sp. ANAM02]|uniref:hypothetical protein n=1 Tax=Bosea sp. ANAM02 TaxID=2020412 RepID=UPI0015642FF3|nr:hypothetical protein [Bosea sp. ANAM02]
MKAVLEPCRKSAAGVEAGAWLGIAVLAAPAAALAEPLRTAQSAVELLPLCTRPNKETVFGTEDQAKASCQAGMRKIAMPGCPAVWLCEAAAPKASYSTQYRTREEAQANCSNGVVRGVIYPEWYWYCDPIPPGTSAAKDIFQGQSEDIQKEYDRMIDKLYSGQKDAVKLPAENPFGKGADASKAAPRHMPAAASEAVDRSKRGRKGGEPPIVCPPNPAGCITVKELGKSSEQLASKFVQSCSGVKISFRWQSCGRVCIEHTEHMSEGESFINYTNRTYPTAYDVTCSVP